MALPEPPRLPGYELGEVLGHGGAGVVYRARRLRDGAVVAIKLFRESFASTALRRLRLQNSAELAKTLEHPGIVRVRDHGEIGGVLFVEMELIDGRGLDENAGRPFAPREAAALMLKIAGAIEHAHERGVLHRDLKPANILLDSKGEPRVADFDLVEPLGRAEGVSSRTLMGAPAYMAPEQMLSGGASIRTDIYSLGVVFYELLTGDLPFEAESLAELTQMIVARPPAPPRAFDRRIDRALETICLTCLEKDPARRYASAGELAQDLKSALGDEPIVKRPRARPVRAWRWARRHPRTALGIGAALLTACAAAIVALAFWRVEAHTRARALEANAFIASGQAGAMLFQLRTYADRVEKVARDPVISGILERGEVIDPATPLVRLAGGFDSLVVEDAEGRILAQTPSPVPAVFGRTYQFRDYFQGAAALARTHAGGAYVSRAYRSESEGLLQFALSTPVPHAGGGPSGLLAATLNAKAAFGAVRMDTTATGGEPITTALLGPRGVDRGDGPEAPTSTRFSVLVHAGVRQGTEYTVAAPTPAAFRAAFGPAAPPGEQFALEYVPPLILADYRDPAPGFEGRWLAALAPVGKNGYVVLVETRRDRSPWSSLIARAVGLLAIATLALALSLALAARILLERRRVIRR